MIYFIFNNKFPDNSGFGLRCQREVDLLSKHEDVTIICQTNKKNETKGEYKTPYKRVQINYFYTGYKLIERPNMYIGLVYELVRNLQLFYSLGKTYYKVTKNAKRKKDKIYVTSSPLTVPFLCYLFNYKGLSNYVLEMHDLEPELAKHIKRLHDTSPVMRIEYFLEKFLSKRFSKIVVTSETQKQRILSRTSVNDKKVFVFPNLGNIDIHKTLEQKALLKKYNIPTDAFVVSYTGNLSYDYTIEGVQRLLQVFPELAKKIPQIRFLIAGDGEGLSLLKRTAKNAQTEKHIIFAGRVSDVSEILSITDVAVIPWIQDEMTETILPTKLLEYMAMKKTVIAPAFGEFKEIIISGKNGYLYNDVADLVSKLVTLYKNKSTRLKVGTMAYNTYTTKFNPETFEAKYQDFLK